MKPARRESWEWLVARLADHDRVTQYERDGRFVVRITQNSGRTVTVVFCDEYLVSLETLDSAIQIAADVDAVVTSSVWNRYSREAKEDGIERGIGVFRAVELLGALWKDGSEFLEYLSREQRDAIARGEDPY